MEYIVELEKGVYIAPWKGDPGRTLKIQNARIFKSKELAHLGIFNALTYRKFNDPKIKEINEEVIASCENASNTEQDNQP